MISSLSRGLRFAFVLGLSVGYVTWHHGDAYAADDDDDEEEGDDTSEDGDPDDDGEDGEEAEDPKEQPPVTAGGLFTLKTYPVNELQRPLTMTQKVTQMRLSLGSDLSAKTAFEFFGVSLDARYGYKDNFTLLGGFDSEYNFKGFSVFAGFEGALAYDIFDIRLAARIYRSAVITDFDDGIDGSNMNGANETATGVPTDFSAGAGTQFSIDLGFPIRYVAKPEIAIIALETLISFDFNGIQRGDGGDGKSCYAVGVDQMNCTEDGVKPDLAPSLGIATNPIPQLSLVVFAQLRIRDFDTTNQFELPATVRIQYSPNQKLDIGAEFKFLNMKPLDPDGDGPVSAPSPIDQRFMNMFIQARY